MAATLKLFLLLVSTSFFSPTFSASPSSTAFTNWWCNQTPYPDQCKSSMQASPPNSVPKRRSQFEKVAIEAAITRALKAQSHNKWLGQKCRNHKERAAWADCLVLYQQTIADMNRTIDPTARCSAFDMQTWLSTAMTNLDTCRIGFKELGLSNYILGQMSNDLPKLISNILALNNASALNPQTYYKSEFPSWLSKGDRRLLQASSPTPDVVVAKDGSGNFRTVQAALDAAAQRSGTARFVIRVKRGVYEEILRVTGSKLKNVMLVGDGLRYTVVTGSRSVGGGSTTFESATVAVTSDGFIARGITFRNTAGPQNHQAVALRSGSDLSVFYHCSFEGYQDTLYTHSQRQFYRECYIYGTVDFIFGNAAAVLQNCMIYARRPMTGQKNMVTAQGRTDPNQNTGISIHNSRVMAAPDLAPVQGSFKTYLGRPWKAYSRTVFLQTYMGSVVDPAGWSEWSGTFALDTLYYGEYRNFGPGSLTGGRVSWKGYRVIRNVTEASQFTVGNFVAGSSWLPGAGVPFTAGL